MHHLITSVSKVAVIAAGLLLASCTESTTTTSPIPDPIAGTDPSGGGDGGVTDATDGTIIPFITTDFRSGSTEAWACFDEAGEGSVYTFYDRGIVEGLEYLRMGTEYYPRSGEEPFHYNWIIVDNRSIILRSQPLGLQDTWTGIEFSEPDTTGRLMKATSGTRGQIFCTIGEQTS